MGKGFCGFLQGFCPRAPLTTALWGAVLAGAVLGRVLEHLQEPEVYSSHPEIEREQLEEWGHMYFDKSSLPRVPSTTVFLEEFPRAKGRGLIDGRDGFGPSYSITGDRSTVSKKHYQVESELPQRAEIKDENLEWMLQNIFMYPRNHNTNESAKEHVRKYIVDSFQLTSGLSTAVQHFQPIQFLTMYEGSIPEGANIIGVLRGSEWSTPNDRPVLVGAHWDTVNFTPGTDDNGSGVAAMLEAARAISHSGCRAKYSIIFVAFDLEEVGSQGSLVFIKDYLAQVLKTKSSSSEDDPLKRFQGAYILDTIMNFNESEGSQTFPTDWSLVLPSVYDEVADSGYKGDFLSMIYRKEADRVLADKFAANYWAKGGGDDKFKLTKFPLELGKELPELDLLADHMNFMRSDHSRFWYMNDSAVPNSLSAVLMTDTGPYRGNMRGCYHTVCDGPEISLYNNPTNLKFLSKITQALTDTLVELGECVWERSAATGAQNYIKTKYVHAKSSSNKYGSPLRNLFNFVRWMEFSSS